MKCTCGYEHHEKYDNKIHRYQTIIGDEKFIEIEGTFLIKKEYDYGPDEMKKVSLYACPKCGTIKMHNWKFDDLKEEE